jgi:hypothetical protein
MSYTRVWARAWSVVAALGVGLGMLEWSAATALVAMLAVTALAAAVLTLLTNELWAPADGRGGGRRVLDRSLAIGSGAVAALALVTASPVLMLLVTLLAVMTCPPVVTRLSTRAAAGRPERGLRRTPARARDPREGRAERADEPAPGSSTPSRAAIATLSDQQLCCLWRHSFWELHDEETLDERLATVAVRQACLEELERRDPSAFAAWLSSGARASGGPERFLHPRAGSDGTDVA